MFFFKKKKKQKNVIEALSKKYKVIKYFYLVIGCFLLAVSFNVFFSPNNLVIGGISGLAIVIEKALGVPTVVFIWSSYITLLILSYFLLGGKVTKYSVIGSILYPLFVYLTQDFATYINFDVSNMLLIALFGALIYGIGSGLTFKYGFSTGGSDIICQIMSKYLKISIGEAMKIFNILVIASSGFFTGNGVIYAWENVMYAILATYIISMLNDKLLLGISRSKSFYIITESETAIKNFLMNELGLGVTILEGRGGYTGDRKKVILCVIPTSEYFLAKEGILEIDKDAIILINDVYQSSGIE